MLFWKLCQPLLCKPIYYCDLSDGPSCLISLFILSFDFSVYWSAFCCCGKTPVAINTRGKGLFGSWFMRL